MDQENLPSVEQSERAALLGKKQQKTNTKKYYFICAISYLIALVAIFVIGFCFWLFSNAYATFSLMITDVAVYYSIVTSLIAACTFVWRFRPRREPE